MVKRDGVILGRIKNRNKAMGRENGLWPCFFAL
ncbi:hypothetical protein SDC9_188573 [bioreactor metagenome]|jgi:hypothetical protein|uniref:Uncharacterized protein n=1 Tax=bioreactor metagenome TaxID=1076179 RepID=A0A645I0H5_9ZZZZ